MILNNYNCITHKTTLGKILKDHKIYLKYYIIKNPKVKIASNNKKLITKIKRNIF